MPAVLLLACLLCLTIQSPALADQGWRCLWRPTRSIRVIAPANRASVQYTQLFDDALAATLVRALGPDRTLRFRYDTDRPDDHEFPNGVTMAEIHHWLTTLLEAWNREPLMPVRLRLDREQSDTENVIRLDDTSEETQPNTGLGGFNLELNGDDVRFHCRAVLNVDTGSLSRRETFEAVAKHELGHCLTLRHAVIRSAVMGYYTGFADHGAAVSFFSLDDLLGIRSAWARNSPGFGSLSGRLQYEDATPVGGGDVLAIDAASGEVLASGVSDLALDGRFRIELPAGRRVRLMAHPLHTDAVLLGEHFLPSDLLTPEPFAPTEYREGDEPAVFEVPDGATRQLPALTVSPPPDNPLTNENAPVFALLPGQRHHVAFDFSGLDAAPVEVRTSLGGLTVSNVSRSGDRVEFDVTAAADAAGSSTVEFRSGEALNLQAGSIWVRPRAGLVRIAAANPIVFGRGATAEIVLSGFGLDRITAARLVRESESDREELPLQIVGTPSEDRLVVKTAVPADAADGPWEPVLETAEGDVVPPPEPRPRLWFTPGRVQATPPADLGEVRLGTPVELTVELTNLTARPFRPTAYRWFSRAGEIPEVEVPDVTEADPGGTGQATVRFTPRRLGPNTLTLLWLQNSTVEAVTEVRLWVIP